MAQFLLEFAGLAGCRLGGGGPKSNVLPLFFKGLPWQAAGFMTPGCSGCVVPNGHLQLAIATMSGENGKSTRKVRGRLAPMYVNLRCLVSSRKRYAEETTKTP